ncbi:MAG: hypothetical protein U0T73_08435 [Chitinophagales bacterium]
MKLFLTLFYALVISASIQAQNMEYGCIRQSGRHIIIVTNDSTEDLLVAKGDDSVIQQEIYKKLSELNLQGWEPYSVNILSPGMNSMWPNIFIHRKKQ